MWFCQFVLQQAHRKRPCHFPVQLYPIFTYVSSGDIRGYIFNKEIKSHLVQKTLEITSVMVFQYYHTANNGILW